MTPTATPGKSSDAELDLLKTPTSAVGIIGNLPDRFLDLLSEGLTAEFRASVVGQNNRIPRRLVEQGGNVRVTPSPLDKDKWHLTVIQPERVLLLDGRGETFKVTVEDPATPYLKQELIGFTLLAPWDGLSIHSSWEAHPPELRRDFAALMRRPARYQARFDFGVRHLRLIRRLSNVLMLVGGVLTGLALLNQERVVLAPIAFLVNILAVTLLLYSRRVSRRLMHFVDVVQSLKN